MHFKFEHVIIIKESKDLSKLFFSELMSSHKVHEQKMNRVILTSNLEQTFQSKVNVKNTMRYEKGETSNKFHGKKGRE